MPVETGVKEWRQYVQHGGLLSGVPTQFGGASPGLTTTAALLRRWLPGPWRLAPLFRPARE